LPQKIDHFSLVILIDWKEWGFWCGSGDDVTGFHVSFWGEICGVGNHLQQFYEGRHFSLGNKKPEIQLFWVVIQKWDSNIEWFHPRSYAGIWWIIWGYTLLNLIWLESYGDKSISLDNVLSNEQLFAWHEECRSYVRGESDENIAKIVLPVFEIEIETILKQNKGILQ